MEQETKNVKHDRIVSWLVGIMEDEGVTNITDADIKAMFYSCKNELKAKLPTKFCARFGDYRSFATFKTMGKYNVVVHARGIGCNGIREVTYGFLSEMFVHLTPIIRSWMAHN